MLEKREEFLAKIASEAHTGNRLLDIRKGDQKRSPFLFFFKILVTDL
ncbi:MAG: hypothetical protein MUW56_13825 [Chryseobacterium sp.]|nr:hypothetical protein [Chryseobacterium sp.]MCJ7934666.1 hypothetical protein [Chryseobacterium sp.]